MAIQQLPVKEATRAQGTTHAGGAREDEFLLVRYIVIAMSICIPLFAALWVGLIALAVTIAGVGYAAPLLMGIAVGTLAGMFFGAWIGFVLFSRRVD
jgi:hypothetical protein